MSKPEEKEKSEPSKREDFTEGGVRKGGVNERPVTPPPPPPKAQGDRKE